MSSDPVLTISNVPSWNHSLRSASTEGRTVFVDFYATWCPPCKAIAPIFTSLASQFPQSTFLRVNVDEQKAIAAKYQVTAMPTFYAIKAGKVVDMLRGADPRMLHALVSRYAGPNPPIAPLPPLPPKAEEAKAKGNELYKAGRYNEAIEAYNEALSLASEPLPTTNTNEPTTTTNTLDKALAPLHTNLSLTHLKTTPPNTSAAVSHARTATTLDPSWAKGWVRLGDALYADAVGEAEVREVYERALRLMRDREKMKEEVADKIRGLKSEEDAEKAAVQTEASERAPGTTAAL